MGNNITMLNIDRAKLRAEIKKQGLTLSGASRTIGYENTYFANVLARGRISRAGVTLIEAKLGIPFEAYMPDPEPEQKEAKKENRQVTMDELSALPAIDYDKLKTVIFEAVFEAFDKALAN